MNFLDRYPIVGKWWWSDRPPEDYVLHTSEGKSFGIGAIAHQNYAMFNVTFALMQGQFHTIEQHERAWKFFSLNSKHLDQLVCGSSLGDRLLLMPKQDFLAWALENDKFINPAARIYFMKVRENDTLVR